MTIPTGSMYMPESLGAGKIATLQDVTANTEVAGENLAYGQAVALKDGKAVPATTAPIYGVAIKRGYMNADRFNGDDTEKTDTWLAGEAVGVLREGTIAVPVSADVNKGDGATIDANGQFKPATGSDILVGIFQSTANTGDTAFLQTSLGFTSGTGTESASSGTASTPTK